MMKLLALIGVLLLPSFPAQAQTTCPYSPPVNWFYFATDSSPGTQVWKTATGAFVALSDADYVAFLAAGCAAYTRATAVQVYGEINAFNLITYTARLMGSGLLIPINNTTPVNIPTPTPSTNYYVTNGAGARILQMAQANLPYSPPLGWVFEIECEQINTSLTIKDFDSSHTLAICYSGQVIQISLADNSSTQGVWAAIVVPLTSSSSYASSQSYVGLGAINGAVKYNGAGLASQAACADLSNGSTGCSMSTAAGGDLSGTLPNPTVAKANGIAMPSSVTSGGVPYYSSTSAMASSAIMTSNAFMTGGGAGAAPNAVAITGLVKGNGASAPAAYGGTSCTNQFPRSLDLNGAATCASVANADLVNSSITLNAGTNFGITAPGAMSLGSTYTLGATTDNLRFNGLGLGVAAPTTAGQIASTLGANNVTGFLMKRFTNVGPTGNFLDFQGSTGTSTFTVDVTGIVTNGTWQGTKIGLAYGGSNADLSATGGTSQFLKQASAGAAITVVRPACADLSNSGTGCSTNLTSSNNTLSSDVNLNNTGLFFTGPSVAQGATGTWLASGSVTLTGASGDTMSCKLWDGTNVIASGATGVPGAGIIQMALSGVSVASPPGNIRIDCNDGGGTTGKIKANTTGAGADSIVTVVRIL